MKRFLFGFLAALFLILNTIPYLHIMADQSMTDSQLKQVGAFALSSLITTGEATELDFSDYTDSDTDFLLALGELVVTGDPSGLVECGLDWLGGTIDDAYDSAIQSIRTWEYNNLPNSFYYWFIDENPPYELAPSYNNIRDLSQPLRRLLTPPDDVPAPTPEPDPNYYQYIRVINENNNTGNDFFWSNVSNASSLSFCIYDTSTSSSIINRAWDSRIMQSFAPLSVYITGSGSSWFFTVSTYTFSNFFQDGSNFYPKGKCMSPNNTLPSVVSLGSSSYNINYVVSSGGPYTSLAVCFGNIQNVFRNINIYVNGDPWALPHETGPTYPIVIPGQLTIWNDQPLQYEFPSDTYLKLPDLTTIITNAINNSGVVMWSDIADVFVDVNGQTAVAVTKIVRNDYDNLYMEQYPYPAMLPGMTEQTKFNEHLLDNSHAYLSPMGTVVQETVNVLPSELVGVLAIGAILTIFAVIINRLLE